jgi:hypothetical protein
MTFRTSRLIRNATAAIAFAAVGAFFGAGTYIEVKLYRARPTINVQPLLSQAQLDLEELHRVTLEAGLTAREARMASHDERLALPNITGDVDTLLIRSAQALAATSDTARLVGTDAAAITGSTTALLDASTKTVAGLQPIELKAADAVEQMRTDEAHLDALIADPDIPIAIANLKDTGAAAVRATSNVADTTADVKDAVHSYLHPTLATKIWHAVANTGVEVGKFFF